MRFRIHYNAFGTLLHCSVVLLLLSLMVACSSTRHVPQGQLLVDKVKINVTDSRDLHQADLINYLRQVPNHKVLWGVKLQLAFYDLSGKDSSNWFNRWIQRVGTPPVIYDHSLTLASASQLRTALVNKGYMNAQVSYDTVRHDSKKKIDVVYNVTLNKPHFVRSVSYNISNDTLRNLILADSSQFLIKPGSIFNRNELENERQMITARLQNQGYFAFNKEYITFTADTAAESNAVDLTMNTMPPYRSEKMKYYNSHRPFFIRNVTFITNYDPIALHDENTYFAPDTVNYKGYKILYDQHYLRPSVLDESCFIIPGEPYDASSVTKTYQALGRLGILRFINIDLRPVGEIDGKIWIDAFILLSKDKSQNVSLSLEGTNSEGDLGFGVGVGYQHRNIGHGSELFSAKYKTSYESLSGDVSGLINNKYTENTGEIGVTFPEFVAPFLHKSFKQKVLATTEFSTSFSYQERPEYTREIAGIGWKYHWSEHNNKTRHTIDLLDINYVYLPKSKANFLDSITNPLLRYSYENHFIMRMGYSFYHTNKNTASPLVSKYQTDIYAVRAAIETAGNLLYGISKALGQNKNDGAYDLFGIRYSQYVKLDADYSFTHAFNLRSSLACHVGAGLAVPYGNSSIMPFEKRFYAGGANSVRGWGVRTLGPGSYDGSNSVNSFINQCGDIRLDMSVEYRAKLFWVIEMGAFIDAGNIWTIRNYENQPGGVFKFDKFYEQIALAYGLGIRLNFNYFLVRFDLGMKAFNPASNQVRWPLTSPNWDRDATFHFSVGYPF
jgi:outer membrane protein assembly factor BamA